ncbi:MAG: DUF4841 domain-containing protein [Bacteroides sp.]|nr:DUF4841 domain-containing protein [Bacteroides sp.]
MKTRDYLNILLAAGSIVLLSACEKEVYSPENAKNTKDLSAPADFDWKTTASATYSITSPVNTIVSIYTDAACTDESLLAEGVVLKANRPTEVTLEIPTYKTNIYVQYPTANGKAIKEAGTDAVTRANDKNIILPPAVNQEEPEDDKKGFGHYYYPNKSGKGTLMFEDLILIWEIMTLTISSLLTMWTLFSQ